MFEQARSRNLQDALRNVAQRLTLGAVQSRLRPKTMLIEYWTADNQVAAVWVTRDAAGIVSRALSPEDKSAIAGLAATADDGLWRGAAERAGGILLAGIPRRREFSQVIIAADGFLYSVPFEMLAEGPGTPLLIEQTSVSYLPTAALLLRPESTPRPAPPWRCQLIATVYPLDSPDPNL